MSMIISAIYNFALKSYLIFLLFACYIEKDLETYEKYEKRNI